MKWKCVGIVAIIGIAACCLFGGISPAQAPTQLPPRVIDCSPKPFETRIEPALPEISVTFDRPMNTVDRVRFEGIRFMGAFPGVRDAEPTWDENRTTCVLPVQLQPDVTYAVAINTSKGRSFKDANGVLAVGFAWVFATGERTEDDFPAHVVECDPPLGAADVDFRKREIKATFNRPIAPGDYSWVLQQGSGEYPGTRGGPSPALSEDRRTVSLEVRLSPGTVYALGVNDLYYYGYKDKNGRPVLPFGWCFRTAE